MAEFGSSHSDDRDSRRRGRSDLRTTDQAARGASATDTRCGDRGVSTRRERLPGRSIRVLQQPCSQHYGLRIALFADLYARAPMVDTPIHHLTFDGLGVT